jgi:ribonucleoside-diphosphate reductase alpha chain
MSSLKNIGYDEVSRNLKLQKLYKQVFKSTKPYSLKDHISKNKDQYNEHILNYTDKQLTKLNNALEHSRDFTMSASGLDKTISTDIIHVNKLPIETPQFMFMLMAMDTFHDNIPKVIAVYNALSLFKITLPTPELKALRTTNTNYASCCTVRIGDSIDSWIEGSKAIVSHTAASAGVGVDISDNSSIGDLVNNDTIKHNGKVSIIKSIDTDISKTSQNGRRGSATVFINFYDPEIETILGLKSPRTAVENRINDLSYGIKFNQLVYDRAKANLPISLFSVRKAKGLNSLFYGKDINKFIEEYERLESLCLYTSQINARDFMKMFANERFETSSYYTINIDEINSNTPYLDEISQSNICVEFMTPTLALNSKDPDAPAIGICVLGNLNQSLVSIEELPKYTKLMVELQTMLALRQTHNTSQANSFVKTYRDIGIGLSNHAHWLARQGLKYGQQEALYLHDEWMEYFSYGLISASCDLVDVFGAAPGFTKTNWATKMPIDRYNKNVDTICQRKHSCDWVALQKRVAKRGMSNCGLSMTPPSESSSIGSNQTSSLEPIKDLLTIKDRQGTNLKQYAPDAILLADKYDFAYDRNINKDYAKHVAITQKWQDKGISSNVFYNPELYKDNKVYLKDIIEDIYYIKFLGGKSMYYQNTKVKDGQSLESGCVGGGCSV